MPRNVVVEKMVGIIGFVIAYALWAHLCGCIYWFIGRVQVEPRDDEHGNSGALPWLVHLRREKPGLYDDEDVSATYMVTLYWAVTTALTMGYGDLNPRTSIEMSFCVVMLLISSVLNASIFGQATVLVNSLDQISRRYSEELQRWIDFASVFRLPRSLRGRVYAYVHYNWQLTHGVQAEKILMTLPTGIRRDIQMYLLSSVVANFPIFGNTPPNFITAIVDKFRAELLVANEYVFKVDEIGKHLYVIHNGRVAVITAEGVVVGKLSDGAYFGEIAILVDVRRTTSVRTVCRCHFFRLSKEDFDEVIEGFPELRDKILAKAMQRLQKTMKVRSKCHEGLNSAQDASDTKVADCLAAARGSTRTAVKESPSHAASTGTGLCCHENARRYAPGDPESMGLGSHAATTVRVPSSSHTSPDTWEAALHAASPELLPSDLADHPSSAEEGPTGAALVVVPSAPLPSLRSSSSSTHSNHSDVWPTRPSFMQSMGTGLGTGLATRMSPLRRASCRRLSTSATLATADHAASPARSTTLAEVTLPTENITADITSAFTSDRRVRAVTPELAGRLQRLARDLHAALVLLETSKDEAQTEGGQRDPQPDPIRR